MHKDYNMFKKGYIPYNKGKSSWNKGLPNTWFNSKGLKIGWELRKDAKKNRIQKICLVCKKQFEVKPALIRIKYCSRACFGISQRGRMSPMKGKKLSESRKEQIRQFMIKRNSTPEGRQSASRAGKLGARAFYKNKPTSIEKTLYDYLLLKEILFEKQKIINGKFVVDAYIPSLNLVIEADGKYWHGLDNVRKKDKAENAYLFKCGYKMIRLGEDEINSGKFKERLVL